jgi:gas vesicle protein
MFHSERSLKDFLLGIIIGGSLGAMIGNTKQGKKVQRNVLSNYRKIKHKARDFIDEAMKNETVKRVLKNKTAAFPEAKKKRKTRR